MKSMQSAVAEVEMETAVEAVTLDISEISCREELAEDICICSTWF